MSDCDSVNPRTFAGQRSFVYLPPGTGLEGRTDAETAKPRVGDPGPGAAGSPLRDSIVARRHFDANDEANEERPPSQASSWNVAPRSSWSSTDGCRREDGAEEGSGCDLGFEGEDGSPPSQAARFRPHSGLEDEGGLMAKAQAEEAQTQLATRIPKELHRRLKLYCVTNDIVLMHFVTEAIEEKLGRKARGGRRTRSEGTS